MKLNAYMSVVRPESLALPAFFGWSFAWALVRSMPETTHVSGARAFALLVLLGPAAVGWVLASMVHVPLHRPFGGILPDHRRSLARWHLVTVTLFAVLFAAFHQIRDTGAPFLAMASLAAGSLALALPTEPGARWFGSRLLFIGGLSLLLLAVLFAREVRGAVGAAPALAALVALSVAAVGFILGFSRRRARARATTRHNSFQGFFADPEYRSRRLKDSWSGSDRVGRSWRRGPVNKSTLAWLRAIRYERSGFSRTGWLGQRLLISLGVLAYALVVGRFWAVKGDRWVNLNSLICDPQQLRSGVEPLSVMTACMLLVMCKTDVFARVGQVYPVSRLRRARLAFVSSLVETAVCLACALGVPLLAAWLGAELGGVAFRLPRVPTFAMVAVAMLPLIPLIQWAQLCTEVRSGFSRIPVLFFGIILAVLVFSVVAAWSSHRATLTDSVWLGTCLLLGAVSYGLYYRSLRRFFLRGDLLQRKSGELSLNLLSYEPGVFSAR
jgi:hypothetical protein